MSFFEPQDERAQRIETAAKQEFGKMQAKKHEKQIRRWAKQYARMAEAAVLLGAFLRGNAPEEYKQDIRRLASEALTEV
jgi:hypothetical protein